MPKYERTFHTQLLAYRGEKMSLALPDGTVESGILSEIRSDYVVLTYEGGRVALFQMDHIVGCTSEDPEENPQ